MIRETIPSLNGLRAISILMVIGSHFQMYNFFHHSTAMTLVGLLLFNGRLRVNIFFTISGFLITKLLIDEQTERGRISLKKFYLRRTIRIFPAYYFLLLFYAVLQLLGYLYFSKTDWIGSATFTKQFFPSPTSRGEMNHFWSLSVEEIFYLIWPFVFITFRHQIKSVAIFTVALITIFRIIASDFPTPAFGTTIFVTGDALLIGCLLAVFYKEINKSITFKSAYIYASIIILGISVIAYAYPFYLLSNRIGDTTTNYILLKVGYGFFGDIGLITNLATALLIISSIHVKNKWFSVLNSPILNHIGKLSYSIYLWQQLFTADREALHKTPVLLLLLGIYVAALFSYRFIEKPFMRLKNKFNLETIPANQTMMLVDNH